MKELIQFTAQLITAAKRAYEQKWNFLGVFALVLVTSVAILGGLGLLPDVPAASTAPVVTLSTNSLAAAAAAPVVIPQLPTKIEIPAIGLTTTIENPTTTDIVALDKDLLKGAVRYPTTAKLGEVGNVVLFGHSSYLPVVINPAYKAFNNIQKLVAGDTVTVYSTDTAYTYTVRNVEKESTNSAGILLSVTSQVLTLSTCDSFGAKTDRFVVTADFVESHSRATL